MEKLYNKLCFIYLTSAFFLLYSCNKVSHQFELQDASHTNIEFNNLISETDSFNIITYEYIYNGGGVAVADFNNDGLQDIYFTGNMVNNALYLNMGDMKFKDVTSEAGASGEGKWCSGVSIVDINGDGWKDIYVCATTYDDPKRANIFYVHQGLNEQGTPIFKDMAEEYGLADRSHSINSAFFDYDNDGDLDMYLLINKMDERRTPNVYKDRERIASERVDKLFRNDWDEKLGHPIFTDVSSEAGIIYEGYGLGLNITDFNKDGWKDIYVTNDFITNDLVYINQKDGTFKENSHQLFKHTSHSAMGNDVVDINNDGYPDVVAVDMMPEDNFRKKTMVPPGSYTTYLNNEKYGYEYQYMRNTLQLNQGFETSEGGIAFSEMGALSGISSTDWSWAPLVADFDNDGLRDLMITNGFPKDITDRDFIEYNSDAGPYTPMNMLLEKIPSVKIENYAYKNQGKGKFANVTKEWGMNIPSFSNGAAYGDMDNDGDLDYVVNNINDKAFIFKNTVNDQKEAKNNWLKVKLKGDVKNPAGIGAVINLYTDGDVLYWDHNIYRGYLSTVDENIHFGLGSAKLIDSLVVCWPDGRTQKLENVEVNQALEISIKDASLKPRTNDQSFTTIFRDDSEDFSFYKHEEDDYIDFNVQPLLPHKLSQYGPGIAVADVNNDGLEDIYIGGSHFYKGTFLIQNQDQSFTTQDLLPGKEGEEKREEELGVLFFDADGDGDSDLYLVSGGYEFDKSEKSYQDRLFENVNGKFQLVKEALPEFLTSGSCVKGADYDRDGDIDLFAGGRVYPYEYPKPVSSYILENKSENGKIKFVIANEKTAPALTGFGMACDALWSDFNQDGWVDLVVAGEWMPLRFFVNEKGVLKEITDKTGIENKVGWWNSLVSGDFDNDGDIDYIAGNLGHNTFFKASEQTPVSIYAADFDGNKGYDIIPTAYYKSMEGDFKEYPLFGRLDLQKQIIKVKAQYIKHADFGKATIEDILNKEQMDSALVYRANHMSTSYIENLGNNQFKIHELPLESQVAPVYGILVDDFNNDGNLDALMVGNDYGTELMTGRFDAFNGLTLIGDGKGGFTVKSIKKSGFYVPGDAKGLVSLVRDSGERLLIATQNRGNLKAYALEGNTSPVIFEPDDYLVELTFSDGRKQKREVYYGNSYLSQSSRKLVLPKDAVKVEITNFKGEKREYSVDVP